jgi:hypothetical protein
MGNIREFTTVKCPFDEVPDRLYARFDGGAAASRSTAVTVRRSESPAQHSMRPWVSASRQATASKLLAELKRLLVVHN